MGLGSWRDPSRSEGRVPQLAGGVVVEVGWAGGETGCHLPLPWLRLDGGGDLGLSKWRHRESWGLEWPQGTGVQDKGQELMVEVGCCSRTPGAREV